MGRAVAGALLAEASRTDLIGAAIARELARRREEIDGDDDLRSIVVTVKVNRGTGVPRAVIFARESEAEYAGS